MNLSPVRSSLPLVAALHFLPGICVTAAYLLLAPLLVASGLPRITAVLAGFVVAGIPVQLLVIRHFRSGDPPAVRFRARLRWWEYVVAIPLLLGVVIAILMMPLGGAKAFLTDLLAWLPPLLRPEPKAAAAIPLAVLLFKLVVDGIVNPMVEETYFRGVLLPRMERLGWIAPLASTFFFALAHLWQLTNVVSIFLIVLPLTLYTWWRKNFYAQAAVHALLNTIAVVSALLSG